jgi:protein-disulfide isomerase
MTRVLLTAMIAVLFGCQPLPANAPPEDAAATPAPVLPPAFVVKVGEAPTRGPADAAVTLVEFLDYECPYCAYAHPTIERLLEQYPREVRWVVKHNPLGFHPRAVPAALLAIEVRRQRGDAAFFEASDMLLGAERLDATLFSKLMVSFALDPKGVARAFALGSAHPTLLADQDQALDLDVRGTPAFFVNGIPVSGAQPYAAFDALVQHELARARALLSAGVARSDLYAALQRNALPPPGLQKVALPQTSDVLPLLGPADARVTVQIFSDFECPFCSRVMPILDELRELYPADVRIVWRHYPLPFHRHALLAARAAEQARAQGGDEAFWALARRMLGTRDQPPERLDPATLTRYADELGLEHDQFVAGLSDRSHEGVIARDIALGQQLGIEATPGFIINGYRLVGAHPVRRFERLVRLSLEEAGGASTDAPPAAPQSSVSAAEQ